MADVIQKVITVDVESAVDSLERVREASEEAGYGFASLKEAKKYIDSLRASLIGMDETSEKYKETVEEINAVQDSMNKAMKGSTDRAFAAEGSYNALSKQMSELKKQFKATNDEAERNALATQIVAINDQLKSMDASIGNYQRNVGNYENAFTKSLGNITGKIAALNNPITLVKTGLKSLGTAMKAIATNPIGLVITALVGAFMALKKGFEGNEEASNKLKRALSAFEPIVNGISNVFAKMANVVGDLAEKYIPMLVDGFSKAEVKIAEFLNKLGIVGDEKLENLKKSIEAQKELSKVSQDLTAREIALEKKKREFQISSAKNDLEISQLRAKAADKEKYSEEERRKALESAIALERKNNKDKVDIAKEEWEILKARAELTKNSKEDNERLAQAEANYYKTKQEYYDKERGLIKQLNGVRADSVDEVDKNYQKALEIQNRANLSLLNSVEREKEIITNKYKEELAELEKYGLDTTTLTQEYNNKINELNENAAKQAKEINDRAELSLVDSTTRELELLKRKYEEEKALLEQNGIDTIALTQEYENKIKDIKVKSVGEDRLKEIDEEAALQQFLADKTISNENDKRLKILEIEEQRLLDKKRIYEELMGLDGLSVEEKEKYAGELARINAEITANEEEHKKADAEITASKIQTMQNYVDGIGNLMSIVSGIWEESINERYKNGEITEEQAKKEFEDNKKMQIAMATVQGLAGVATAIATAWTLGPIRGAIVGSINAATTLATTIAQIQKIKNTKWNGGGSGSVTAPSMNAAKYSPDYEVNVTGASETDELSKAIRQGQSDTKVYVLESDIREVGKKATVREEESSF